MGEQRLPGGFLPPDPGGAEPDLAQRPAAPPEPGPQPGGYAPPAHAEAGPQAPPPPGPGAAVPSSADNGPAVLGFCLSLSSAGLLLMSAGLSSLVSVGLAIPGMLQSRKGSRRVQEGLTTRNASLASAGWVIGIVSLVLSVVATIVWIVVAIAFATNEDVRRDFEREFDRQYEEQRSSAGVVLMVCARLVGAALS